MVSSWTFASSCELPMHVGTLEMRVYRCSSGGPDAIAIVARVRHGGLAGPAEDTFEPEAAAVPTGCVLLRVQDQCITSEVFGSVKCDCRSQLDFSMGLLASLARATWARERCGAASGEAVTGGGQSAPPSNPHSMAEGSCESHGGARCAAAHEVGGGTSLSPEPRSCACSASALEEDSVCGLLVYLMQEGRGIGLAAKIAAYALQEEGGAGRGLDTVDANRALGLPDDAREYGAVADVLRDLGLMDGGGDGVVARGGASSGGACAPLLLLSNNPRKAEKLAEAGVHIAGRRPCALPPLSEFAARYMRTKAERMGHDFPAGLF